jgi:hypothetical protein
VRSRKASRPTAAKAAREPRVASEQAGEPLRDEAKFDPIRCLSAYDGADLAGFVAERTGRFIAYDLNDYLIGAFTTLRAAVRSIPAVQP